MIWLLVFLPVLSGLALWRLGDDSRVRLGVLGAAAAGLTLLIALLGGGQTGDFAWSNTLTLSVALPPMAQAVAMTVAGIAIAVLMFASAHEAQAGLGRLVGLLLVFTGGMELVVIAADLLTLLIGWEIVGACSWALIGHRWDQSAPGLSANYAFVMTRTGDLGLFMAVFATFSGTGGLSYVDLGNLEGNALLLASAGILIAAISKAGQLPFSPWLFRAMDGPTSVSAHLHSATMVAAGVYVLARLQPQLSPAPGFALAAMLVGLTTAILGGISALRQIHAKKVLAGSTSAQMGLMIASVGAGFPGVAILHLIMHAATKSALFFSAGIAQDGAHGYDLRQMRLGRTLPLIGALTLLAALSLAGVPPVAGSWSKEEIVKALEQAGPLIAAAGILAGGLSAAYAARFFWLAYGPGDKRDRAAHRGETLAFGLLGAGLIGFSAFWIPAVHDAAASLLGARLPEASPVWLIASLTTVAIGVLGGVYMARRPGSEPLADWFGLPTVIDAAISAPFAALARSLAWADDTLVDLIPRSAALAAHHLSRSASRSDGRGLPAWIPGGAAALTRKSAKGADRSDGTGLPAWIPNGTSFVVSMAGADLRRAQTGYTHHYYAILIAGVALGIVLLVFGG